MSEQILVCIFAFVGLNTVYIIFNKCKANNICSLYAQSAAKETTENFKFTNINLKKNCIENAF
jgi:hypothetical protein